MYIQTRKRILNFPFSSPLSNSFVLFSLHFPLNLNCQTNWKREKLIHEVLNSGVSTSLIPPHGGDYEGGDEQWKVHDYEVFLSFRGKDTHKGFTDHLYASLVNAGIHVFRDDNELHVGEVIGSELLRSTTNSKISIPIISENYAFSKWCLCELAQILKYRRSGGQIVLPVFYKVKPSHLRHLTGRLGDAINAHKKDSDDTVVKEWEEALKEVSNLKGWESEKIDNGHEGALVKSVVTKVMSELKTLFLLNVPEQLVGIDDHVEQIMSSIDGEFNDTRIIGIYGMGGIENQKEPEKRSRLWNHEEVVDVLDNNKGSSKIEALRLGKYDRQKSYRAEQFKELTNLRFLHVNGANFTGDFQNLLPQLRWFHWEGCRLDFKIANLHPKKLVMLNLSGSGISEEWGGWDSLKMATKLRVLNLSYCQSLRRTPELSTFENLENLILEHCEYLKEIHPSIGDIKTLVSLDVRKCYRLKGLPAGVGRMKELRELLLDHAWLIQDIPISRGCLMKLETLSASFCRRLVQLPESMGSLVSLTELNLSHSRSKDLLESMDSLVSLTQLDLSCSRIIELPKLMSSLVSLTELNLCVTQITELPNFIGSLKELETLNVSCCALLARIPSSIGQLASLQYLSLQECRLLREIPDSIGKLASLTKINLHWTAIEELPESIGSLKKGCCSLREIPDSIGKLASLTELHLKWTTIEALPESIGSLKELKTLNVSWCKSLTHILGSIGDQVSLKHLLLHGCHLLKEIPNSIGKLASLTKLDLSETWIEILPESIGSLKELETLDASNCVLLAHIPSSIGHLSSLSLLDLRKCHKLTQLPESMGSLMSLTRLYLSWTGIEELPKSIDSLKKLKILDTSNCASLTCISSSIGHPASL
ncbi:disease resistance protein RPV1-like [Eucalyptus grandis]|uniref:disease resistance protein RPV1-like n=1 Tax=Eucalyptus grandis TaxID=71139 RepID=UPI00192E805C|nr:disease resistance protein RPV1-like [Eucalyptus grandis]